MRQALEITTRSSCPHKCQFCPQSTLASAYQPVKGSDLMSLETFSAVLDRLPRDVQIDFSGFVEPFSNPNAAMMMRTAREMGFGQITLYSTLMGLRDNQIGDLVLSKPNVVRIHVPDTKAFTAPEQAWLHAFDRFRTSGLSATYMSMGEPPLEIKVVLAKMGIPVELPDMLSRGGNLWKKRQLTGRMRCTMNRWHSNVLLPDGTVVGCCMDYSLSAKLGNLLTNSYEDIYRVAEEWRAKMENNCEGSICSYCEWATPA